MHRVSMIVLLACIIVACGQAGNTGEGDIPMRAEIDLYSGRPNPSWDLTPDEVAQLKSQLQRLSETSQGEVRQNLGYRGINVSATSSASADISKITVSNGIVVVERGGRRQKLADKDRALERWLLQTAKGHIDAAVYDLVAQDIGR